MRLVLLASLMAMLVPEIVTAADTGLIEAARREGKVTWYAGLVQDQAARPLAVAFEKKYPGVKVDIVAGRTQDLVLRMLDEIKVDKLVADVSHSATAQATLPAEQLAVFRPDVAADYPDDLKDPDGRWYGHLINFLVPAYNTDLVKEADAPKTYEDLLKPEWKGKIAWPVSMTPGGPPGFIGTVLATLGQEKGMAYLKALSDQKIVNVPSSQRVVLDQVIVGEYLMAICTYSHHSDISAAEGAPVKRISLSPMVTSTIDPIFILKNGPHPNAARLFVDFTLSREGQDVLVKAGYIAGNPKSRVPGSDPVAHTLTPAEIAAGLKDWIRLYDGMFK